jgi:hypothetical protein
VYAAGDQTDPRIVPDGSGGVLFAWTDPRAGHASDIYALRLDSDGQRVPGWAYYGQPVCDAAGEQSKPRLVADGSGGAWVVWKDQRSDLAGDLRTTHVLGNGTFAPGFTSAGRELCTAPGAQADVELAGDGAGGFFAVWTDERTGDADVYAQHVLAGGTLAADWPVNGRALGTAPGAQDQPAIANVAAGRAVIAWRDARTGPARVYATAIVDGSTTGVPVPAAGALRVAAAGATSGLVNLRLSLPLPGRARVELVDVSGRVVARRELDGPLDQGAVALPAARLEPGLYFALVRQGNASASARVTILR